LAANRFIVKVYESIQIPDAKGAKVAQKSQKRISKLKSKPKFFLVFFASFAQLLRLLRPAVGIGFKALPSPAASP
jgi:hypothetical protein